MAISPDGFPYVSFEDTYNGWKESVMKYDSLLLGFTEKVTLEGSVYPNPASQSLTIMLKGFPDKLNDIEITDMRGIRMFTDRISEKKIVVNVSNYPSGVYILKVRSQQSTWSKKFIKM
jgi:hypothetical protein